jgi:hypothetical protein
MPCQGDEEQEEGQIVLGIDRKQTNSGLGALFNPSQGVLCKIANLQEQQKSCQNQTTATPALTYFSLLQVYALKWHMPTS